MFSSDNSGYESRIRIYETLGKHEQAWHFVQQVYGELIQLQYPPNSPALAPWNERMVLGYEARGMHEEAWQLIRQIHDGFRLNSYPLRSPALAFWNGRMVVGYQARGMHEEAWRLIRQIHHEFLLNSYPLCSPALASWNERMVLGYEARGMHEEAWQLTCQIYQSFCDRHCPLSRPVFGPWIERMVLGYHAHGEDQEGWHLTRRAYDSVTGEIDYPAFATPSGLLSKILQLQKRFGGLPRDCSLMSLISREERLSLLLLPPEKLPSTFRASISKSLRVSRPGDTYILLKTHNERLRVHQDILCFWSPYFRALLSGRWGEDFEHTLDPGCEYSETSLRKIFSAFIYSGEYRASTTEELNTDLRIADYYILERLTEIINASLMLDRNLEGAPDPSIAPSTFPRREE